MKLTPFRPSESQLQGQILEYLAHEQVRGRVVWFARINGGAVKSGNRWIVNYRLYMTPGKLPISKGMADIIALLPGGKLALLEVKRPGERTTDEQLALLEASRDAGALAYVVRHWEDVRSVLFAEVDPAREQAAWG